MKTDTDSEWELWGRRDPYYGVITSPKFRREVLTDESRKEFFDSGDAHVEYVMQMIRQHIDSQFAPKKVLDFGCGVGRTLVAFAKVADKVVGVDVAPSMLAEARKNCCAFGADSVQLELSDDDLSQVKENFDLIHSFITFQHIEPARGKRIIGRLVEKLEPGGIAALHVLYSKSAYGASLGVAPYPTACGAPVSAGLGSEPEMQMNAYGATELMFMTQALGVGRVHAEFTDHGGELGLFVFFRVPAESGEKKIGREH